MVSQAVCSSGIVYLFDSCRDVAASQSDVYHLPGRDLVGPPDDGSAADPDDGIAALEHPNRSKGMQVAGVRSQLVR